MKNILKNINKKIYSIPIVAKLRDSDFNIFERKEILKFKNKYAGERCFVIGNGPSLNNLNLSYLNKEFSFGVNGIFYKSETTGFVPTFYMVEDNHVFNDNLDKINDYNVGNKFFPMQYQKRMSNRKNAYFFNMDKGFYNVLSPYFCRPRFSIDFAQIAYCGQSVTMLNLQLAFYMGFTTVYLIGMDHNYIVPDNSGREGETIISFDSDPNHFHPDYFGAGKKWHNPHLERVEMSYKFIKNFYEKNNRLIINATDGGRLDIFDRVDYNDIFKK